MGKIERGQRGVGRASKRGIERELGERACVCV